MLLRAKAQTPTRSRSMPVTSKHIASRPMAPKNKGDGRAVGKTEGGLNPKPHPVCDGQGRPVH